MNYISMNDISVAHVMVQVSLNYKGLMAALIASIFTALKVLASSHVTTR